MCQAHETRSGRGRGGPDDDEDDARKGRRSSRPGHGGDERGEGVEEIAASELLESLNDAFILLDGDRRVTYANPRAEQLVGRARDALIGRRLPRVLHEAIGSEDMTRVLEALERGEATEVETWCPTMRRWVRLGTVALRQGFAVHFHDIGERKRNERVRDTLADASRALVETLDARATLANVARLLVPDWADWCVIDLLDPDGNLDNVVIEHVDREKLELVRKLRRRFPPSLDDPVGAGHVVRTGESSFLPDLSDQTLRSVAKDAEHLEMLRSLGLRSAIVVPLKARGRTLGAITMVTAESPHPLTEANLPHVQDLASRCALAVDNAQLHTQMQTELARRRRTERELRESESRERGWAAELETVINAVPAVVFISHDTGGKRITGNRVAAEFLRQPIDANLSRTADAAERPANFRVCKQGVELAGDQLPVQRAARGERVENEEIEVHFDDGTVRHLFSNATPLYDDAGAVRGSVSAMLDITQRKRAEQELAASEARERLRALQQAAVADIGREALASRDLQALFERAVHVVADTLCSEMCKVLELMPGGDRLLLRAGVGFKPELIGRGTVDTGLDSQAGYTLRSAEPVIVEDLRTETRFNGPPLLREHRVVSGMSVIIDGPDGEPWGVLGTHTTLRRVFSRDDVHFLQAVANLLASAIQRHTTEQRLHELNQTLERRVAERTAEAERRARQLQRMVLELTHTEQREREKLARMLHDEHQQLLVGAKMQAQMLRHARPDAVPATAQRLADVIDEAIRSSRTLSYELSPPSLHSDGLAAALHWLAPRKLEKYGLKLHVETDPAAEPASESVRVLLFQLVRELLLNIVKHARTDEAWVRMQRDAHDRLVLIVEDRGCGFDLANEWQQHSGDAGHGLAGMYGRLQLLDGELNIESHPGDGTTVTLRIPLSPLPGHQRDEVGAGSVSGGHTGRGAA